ncbi:type VI secretion system tip protein TssI/VgrG, partial [Caballeronia sp. LZ043]|uniref:type VI secretion system tip protein TssI/VgrG n=2 Tax=unclassified Caballeronia TaxID=2646786 RepID=UPI00285DF388
PKATGPQTAVVVGPAGETIWTDQHGRVKLQFRWDRYGKSDENSSCWVRVSDAWAGSNYGGIYIPRIGQEVVVDFMNGNIDRPLITGRVYNASQMPPFNLPDSATQSGFLTRTPGGNSSNANMFRFEDKQGSEQIKLHAERNYDTSVEANTTHTTAGSHTIEVGLPLASGDSSTSPPPSGAQR